MSIEKVGTFDGTTLRGWVIDQTDGQEITLDQLVTIDSVFHDAPKDVEDDTERPDFGPVDETVEPDNALEVFVPEDVDEPPIAIETVPVAGTPVVSGRVAGSRPGSGRQVAKAPVAEKAPAVVESGPIEVRPVNPEAVPASDLVVADPEEVKPLSNAARRARGKW